MEQDTYSRRGIWGGLASGLGIEVVVAACLFALLGGCNIATVIAQTLDSGSAVTVAARVAKLDPQSSISIAAVVFTLTQLVKFAGWIPDSWGLAAVFFFALLGLLAWAVSNETDGFAPALIWPYFVAWVSIAAQTAGLYGFVRAIMPATVTSTASTPPRANAQDPTGKL